MIVMNELLSAQNVLHALEIFSIIGGILAGAFKLGQTTSQLTTVIEQQARTQDRYEEQLIDLKQEFKIGFDKVHAVLTTVAVQESRLDMLEKWYDELRRGI